jgi:hypothetical protein
MSIRRFFRRSWWDGERSSELESYLAIETDDNIARGMDPKEARAAAERKLGNRTIVREDIYRMNTVGWLDTVWRDLRFAALSFAKTYQAAIHSRLGPIRPTNFVNSLPAAWATDRRV